MTDPRDMQAPTGSHAGRSLDRDDLLDDPLAQLSAWLADADAAGVPLPNAMALATADAAGSPSVRHVLLRGVGGGGLDFYTNTTSRKGQDLAANPRAALVFLWKELDRQITVRGTVEPVDDDASDGYFATRPRDAQIGAWASPQSAVIDDRRVLDDAVAETTHRFSGGEVPRPPHWGGYRLVPDELECWQGRASRLHDRFRYRHDDVDPSRWTIERLAP